MITRARATLPTGARPGVGWACCSGPRQLSPRDIHGDSEGDWSFLMPINRPGPDPPEIRYMARQAVTDAGSAGAGPLYDARRGVYYTRPVLRGWLHLLCFWASLAGGTLLVARAHGGAPVAAAAVYSASLSALFGTSALYHRGYLEPRLAAAAAAPGPGHDLLPHRRHGHPRLPARRTPRCRTRLPGRDVGADPRRGQPPAWRWPATPEFVAGALFIGLGCVGGLALPWAWIHAGP